MLGAFLSFTGVDSVSPAFADEIFRVFRKNYPHMELRETTASPAVARMIASARGRESHG